MGVKTLSINIKIWGVELLSLGIMSLIDHQSSNSREQISILFLKNGQLWM